MTSSQHGPYVLGYTRATMAGTTGSEPARGSQSLKSVLISDRRLQLAYMKPKSLVTADQLSCGKSVPGPCTHRPSRHLSCLYPSRSVPARGKAPKVYGVIGTKS